MNQDENTAVTNDGLPRRMVVEGVEIEVSDLVEVTPTPARITARGVHRTLAKILPKEDLVFAGQVLRSREVDK